MTETTTPEMLVACAHAHPKVKGISQPKCRQPNGKHRVKLFGNGQFEVEGRSPEKFYAIDIDMKGDKCSCDGAMGSAKKCYHLELVKAIVAKMPSAKIEQFYCFTCGKTEPASEWVNDCCPKCGAI